jgi:hypothetical protein
VADHSADYVAQPDEELWDLTELSKLASHANWPSPASNFTKVLTSGLDWYMRSLRILRNQLVHNERTATLLPAIDSPRTTVEIKKPHFDETTETFDLDKFLRWSYGHFLIFCSAFASATDAMY